MTSYPIARLIEAMADAPDMAVILAIACTRSIQSNEAFAGSGIDQIQQARHPQALWQLTRAPFITTSHSDLRSLVDTVLDREAPWIRRKLVTSSLIQLTTGRLPNPESTAAVTRLLASLTEVDLEYLNQLYLWLDMRGDSWILDLLPAQLKREITARFPHRRKPNISEKSTQADVTSIRFDLERASLDLDVSQSLHGSEKYYQQLVDDGGRGSFSKIEDATAFVLSSTPQSSRAALVSQLLRSHDEGIRWAVASRMDLSTSGERITSATVPLLLQMLHDESPWVVREALTSVVQLGLTLRPSYLEKLARGVVAAVDRASRQGWPKTEILPAVARLIAANPSISSWLDLADSTNSQT
ncbi:hypothetical protein SD37_17750 [Amycolatopsis orientalis]|uniref:HEAT repeat domain-containing protein n=1 Tax=Amycolatopsis orientalis TaxID=31958 RepID=A0A193BYR0_AMYOR|nr:HEAT repeat domain-containing protein [Amycolatopsis orientalis]ANN17308.1 hypothetical protein SD37_17750 [Amycolatopsis orientalis]